MFRNLFGNREAPARLWALAAGAMTARAAGAPLDRVAYNLAASAALERLREQWEIETREQALNTLVWLRDRGHNETFVLMHGDVAGLDAAKFEASLAHLEPAEAALQSFVWRHREEFKLGRVLAWDFDRLINLSRLAHTAGLLSEEEAWQRIAFAAVRAQRAFDSWEELGANYLLGHRYWRGGAETPPELLAARDWLVGNSRSPWRKLAWGESLYHQ